MPCGKRAPPIRTFKRYLAPDERAQRCDDAFAMPARAARRANAARSTRMQRHAFMLVDCAPRDMRDRLFASARYYARYVEDHRSR